jgi:membrane protease subunit HflC
MSKQTWTALIIILVAFFVILTNALYVVNEAEQVVITQFGKPVGEPVFSPGLHIKMPFIQETHIFEKRVLEWDGDPNQIPTKDKRFISLDTYARWRISDPLLFYKRVRDERGAQSRLDDILDGETRDAIAGHDLVEIIRSTNREPRANIDLLKGEQVKTFKEIQIGRQKIMDKIFQSSSKRIAKLGIELMDLRFKRINYVSEVQQKIFERMISERQRIASKYRSEGQGEASRILGKKERELKRIRSEAYRKAEIIKGEADAKATAIYARAYNRNRDSREFYGFMKTMDTYTRTLSEKDWLILSTQGDIYKYLKNQRGN